MAPNIKASVTGKDGALICVGDLLLIRYGNGTQPIRVREITAKGNLKIERFLVSLPLAKQWRPVNASLRADDARLIGHLSPNDPRFAAASNDPRFAAASNVSRCTECLAAISTYPDGKIIVHAGFDGAACKGSGKEPLLTTTLEENANG